MVKHRLMRLEKVVGKLAPPAPPMTMAEATALADELCQELRRRLDHPGPPATGPPNPETQRLVEALQEKLGIG